LEDLYDDDFVVWKLKDGFDDANITETDIQYYRTMRNLDEDTAIVIVTSKGKVRSLHF